MAFLSHLHKLNDALMWQRSNTDEQGPAKRSMQKVFASRKVRLLSRSCNRNFHWDKDRTRIDYGTTWSDKTLQLEVLSDDKGSTTCARFSKF